MRRVGVLLLFAAYAAALLLWLADGVGHLFLPPATAEAWGFWGLLSAPVLVSAILIWALWPPRRRRKYLALGAAFLLGVVAFNFDGPLRALSDRLYVTTHHDELERFISDIRAYGRITSMTHGLEWFKFLNGTMVAYTEEGRDSVGAGSNSRRPMLATILERDSIDLSLYRDFGERLRELHFEDFSVDDEVAILRRDRDTGLAYLPREGGPLAVDDDIPGTSLIVTRHVADDWYYWYCCR